MPNSFTPTAFLKTTCPFCFKLRVALLEAGMLKDVKLREFAEGTPEAQAIKNELSSKLEKVSFPAAEIAPGEFKTDSDKLVSHFLGTKNIDEKSLATLQAYKGGPFESLMHLFKENRELKKGAAASA